MRIKTDILWCASGMIAQVIIALCVWPAHWAFALVCEHMLDGKRLPPLTDVAFVVLRPLPVAVGILILLGFWLPAIRKRFTHWMLALLLAESLCLALLLLGLVLPFMHVHFTMSP